MIKSKLHVNELKEYLKENNNAEVAETLSENGIDGKLLLKIKEHFMGNRLRIIELVENGVEG